MKMTSKPKKHSGNTGRILNHLKEHGQITSMEAFEQYGATRLSAIIFNLRNEGYNIKSEDTSCVNRYGRPVHFVSYKLEKD